MRNRPKSIEIQAAKAGIVQPAAPRARSEETRIKIGVAIDQYLAFVKAHRSPRTYLTYRYTIATLLRQSYRKTYVDQVGRERQTR